MLSEPIIDMSSDNGTYQNQGGEEAGREGKCGSASQRTLWEIRIVRRLHRASSRLSAAVALCPTHEIFSVQHVEDDRDVAMEPTFDLTLALTLQTDAMYFSAAKQSLQTAIDLEPQTKEALAYQSELEDEERRILSRYGDDKMRAYNETNEMESVAICMEGAAYSIAVAYAPMLQELAAVHMFSIACLEAHINIVASRRLTGRMFEEFDHLRLTGKWQLAPSLLGGRDFFDAGTEPFQSFAKLNKFRNALVHFKEVREEYQFPAVPSFLQKLGLTVSDATNSVAVVPKMISFLCSSLNQPIPDWLSYNGGYFALDISS